VKYLKDFWGLFFGTDEPDKELDNTSVWMLTIIAVIALVIIAAIKL
jgi:hypothetical protein